MYPLCGRDDPGGNRLHVHIIPHRERTSRPGLLHRWQSDQSHYDRRPSFKAGHVVQEWKGAFRKWADVFEATKSAAQM